VEDLKVLLFQAVRELLSNVIRHSRASDCSVSLKTEGGKIRIDVKDNGIGFKHERIDMFGDDGKSFGVFSVRERLEPLGGSLEICSKPGEGTRVTIVSPLADSVP
jgi:signal transduction histidine kinase